MKTKTTHTQARFDSVTLQGAVTCPSGEMSANVRIEGMAPDNESVRLLIAAAPDLLSVCASILGAGLIECNCGSACDGSCSFAEIVRAVAKAEGR